MTDSFHLIDHLNFNLIRASSTIISFIIGIALTAVISYFKLDKSKLDKAEFDKFKELHKSDHNILYDKIENFQTKLELSVRRIEDKFEPKLDSVNNSLGELKGSIIYLTEIIKDVKNRG